MNTFHDFSDLGELLRVLPARLRLVADYVSREDALEREAAAELLDECAARLEASVTGWPNAMRMYCTPWAAAASW